MRYRLEVRLTSADVGSRVVIRWRRPRAVSADTPGGGAADTPAGRTADIPAGGTADTPASGTAGTGDEIADVLGTLEDADDAAFTVRRASGELVVIPRDRALAAKTIPPAPPRRTSSRRPGGPEG